MFDNLTLATFLKAELGFFGVMVLTTVQTPRFNGLLSLVYFLFNELKLILRATDFDFLILFFLFLLISWLIVGILICKLSVIFTNYLACDRN